MKSLLRRWLYRCSVQNALAAVRQPHEPVIAEDLKRTRAEFSPLLSLVPAPQKKALILSSLSLVLSYKLEGIFGYALKKQGYELTAVCSSWDRWRNKYLSLFGFDRTLHIQRYAARANDDYRSVLDAFLKKPITVDRLMELEIGRVDAGRIALSDWLYENKFTKMNLTDPETIAGLQRALHNVIENIATAEALVTALKPDIVLVAEKGLTPFAEISGVCLAQEIPVVQFVHSQNLNDLVLKRYRYENRHQHPFSLDAVTWEQVKQLKWTKQMGERLIADFETAYKEGTWFKRKFLHFAKEIKPADQVKQQLGLDPNKKTAVIFSHVLWDATFFYGKGLFVDYETWLVETVRAACQNDRLNWVVKLHPDLVWKMKYEKASGSLRDISVLNSVVAKLPPHIKIVTPDTDIDTYSFFEMTDYCVTVRGTIGIEMACRGIPVITAGTGRYAGHGFTVDSTSAEDYLNKLATLETCPKMSAHEQELAQRFAYALFHSRLWEMKSFRLEKTHIDKTGQPLDHNLVLTTQENGKDLSELDDVRRFREWVASEKTDYYREQGEC